MEALFTTIVAAQLADITRRQLDYWVKTGVIEPAMTASRGKAGNVMLFNLDNIFQLRILSALLELGFSFRELRRLTDEEAFDRLDIKKEERPPAASIKGEPVKKDMAGIIEEVKEGTLKTFWVFSSKEGLVGIDLEVLYNDTKKDVELIAEEQNERIERLKKHKDIKAS